MRHVRQQTHLVLEKGKVEAKLQDGQTMMPHVLMARDSWAPQLSKDDAAAAEHHMRQLVDRAIAGLPSSKQERPGIQQQHPGSAQGQPLDRKASVLDGEQSGNMLPHLQHDEKAPAVPEQACQWHGTLGNHDDSNGTVADEQDLLQFASELDFQRFMRKLDTGDAREAGLVLPDETSATAAIVRYPTWNWMCSMPLWRGVPYAATYCWPRSCMCDSEML
jgi:hypothetical protein